MSDEDLDSLLRKVGRAPPRPLDAGFVDERYEVGARIGEGGFGAVYEAFDRKRGEHVALKILRRASSDALLRFKREFRQLAGLSEPGLVRLYDLHGDGERWYFTMERVRGVPFDEWAREASRLRAALDELSRALSSLHARGWVHRDVKPSNVLVEPSGRLVLLDFGLVFAHDDARSTSMVGTPAYLAPEVAAGASPSPAADWYAVGVMLFEALTGELPFGGAVDEMVVKKQTERAPPVRSRAPGAPEDLAALCDALLDPRPSARPVPGRVARPAHPRPPLVGRRRELAELDRMLAAAPSVVRVVGTSGVGKSALVERFSSSARERGVHVLASRCHPRDHTPFVAIDGVVDELSRMLDRMPPARARALAPRDAGVLSQAFPVLRSIPGFDARLPSGGARSGVGTALAELLERWGEGARWLVVIDDAQWGDADSAAVLSEVLRDRRLPLCIVVVHPEGSGSPLLDAIGRDARTVEVAPLDADEARDLARQAGARDGLDGLVAESGGHPMFLVELVRERVRGGEGRSLRDILLARVASLSPDARRCARLIAVAGRPVSTATLRAADLSSSAIEEVGSAGLVVSRDGDELVIVHDRVREVLVADIGDDEARALHERLAGALSVASPERAEALAFHLAEAGRYADAAAQLLRAAREATATRAFAQARALYARLFSARQRAGADDGRELPLRIESAEASARAGLSVEAAESLLAASRLASSGEALSLRVRAAEYLLSAGHIERGERILDEQLARLGLSLPSSTPGRLLGVVRHTVGRRVDRWRPAPTSEARLSALWSATRGALLVEPVRALALGATLVREAARPGANAHARMGAAMIDAMSLVAPRGPDALPRALGLLAAELADDVEPRVLELHAMAKGIVESAGLAFRESVTSLGRAVTIGAEHGLGQSSEEALCRAVQGSSAWVLGDVDHLVAKIPALCAELEERDHLLGWMLATMHRAWLVSMQDGLDAGAEVLEGAGRRWASRGRELQGWWLDIGRIHLALGRGDGRTAWQLSLPKARRFQERIFATLMHRLEAQTFLVRAAIVLARERRATDAEIARAWRAVDELASVPSAWTRAHALCLRAGLASVTGDVEGAVAALRRAIPALDEAGMPLMRMLADDALGTLLGGDEGSERVLRARERLDGWRIDRARAIACTFPGAW